jgi:hypothetical protein
LLQLAHDLPAAWNAPTADNRTRQRLIHILIREVVIDLDAAAHEAVVLIHWMGGRHTETRVPRVRTKPRRSEPVHSPVAIVQRLAQEWPDREIAVTLNRMRSKTAAGENWTSISVREVRERLGVPPFTPSDAALPTVGVQAVARQFGICIPSVLRLIREGTLPAEQEMPYAPWKIPRDALSSAPVVAGLRRIKERRPKNLNGYQRDTVMRLPGL